MLLFFKNTWKNSEIRNKKKINILRWNIYCFHCSFVYDMVTIQLFRENVINHRQSTCYFHQVRHFVFNYFFCVYPKIKRRFFFHRYFINLSHVFESFQDLVSVKFYLTLNYIRGSGF